MRGPLSLKSAYCLQHCTPTPPPHETAIDSPLHTPGARPTQAPPTASQAVCALGLMTVGAGDGACRPPAVHTHVAMGLPAHWHIAFCVQSASLRQGKAHLPAATLHLCAMHWTSVWQDVANGPGVETELGVGAGAGVGLGEEAVGAGVMPPVFGGGDSLLAHAAASTPERAQLVPIKRTKVIVFPWLEHRCKREPASVR